MHFWGRTQLANGASMFIYQKGGRTRQLIKRIKYGGRKDLAYWLGIIYGRSLVQYDAFNQIDCIVPVPLHPARFKERGYNQSEWFARGLSRTMAIPVQKEWLFRTKSTHTQTTKNRVERYQNLKNVFRARKEGNLLGQHVLLVDDVLTTGATLECCADQLMTLRPSKLSMLTIAMGLG